MKKAIIFASMLCLMLTGCQKTPEKSAVVSKADGLSKDVIAKPLKSGEKRTIDIPEHWKVSEKKSNDRVTISADLKPEKMKAGNLPVIEMSNQNFSQKELQKLVSYFSKDEDLYIPEIFTRDKYQNAIDRIEKKDGAYGNQFMWPVYQKLAEALKKSVKLAPETQSEAKKAEVKFQKKEENPALEVAKEALSENKDKQNSDAQDYFSADIGKNRDAYFEAERYDPNLGNSSSFHWQKGDKILEADFIPYLMKQTESQSTAGMDPSGYSKSFGYLLNQYKACLEQQGGIDKATGERQAYQVLKDLDIKNLKVSSSEKVLWFPKGAYPSRFTPGFGEDLLWQADLTKAEVGYQYVFSPYIEGIPAKQEYGIVSKKSAKSYIPPFPVETITITVTKDGIKSLSWEGMTKEVKQIAENTKLLPFKTIQSQLLDQIFYWYTQMGQPQNDPTLFDYKVSGVQLEYTYIPAYGKPKDAWLVPAWIFTVAQASGGQEQPGDIIFVLNALDGGAIGRTN